MAGSSPAGRPGWLVAAAPALLFLDAFVVFLRHNAYPLASTEILGCLLLVSIAGAALGAFARHVPAAAPLVMAGSMVGFIDLQFDVSVPIDGVGETAALLAAVVALTAVLHWAGPRVLPVVGMMAAAALVTTLVTPASRLVEEEHGSGSSAGLGPFVLHLVFDEHIGLAGLRAAGRTDDAERLNRFLEGQGFLVFDAAYSQHHITVEAISHLLNFVSGHFARELVEPGPQPPTTRLKRSQYFAQLKAAGYAIDVYQSDHFDLCHTTTPVASCHTSASSKLGVLKDSTLGPAERGSVVLGVFLRQSDLWNELREQYSTIRERVWPALPAWDWALDAKVSTIAATVTLERLERDLGSAARGRAVIAHVLLPHSPYVYDSECATRPPSDWLQNQNKESGEPPRNTPEGRALRYARYGDQLACTQRWIARLLRAIPEDVRRDAIVILHGDHGSRITVSPQPPAPPVESDDLDIYSTLFAVRSPGIGAGHDVMQSPIPCLLAELTAGGFRSAPRPDACLGDPVVVQRNRERTVRPLKRFELQPGTGKGPTTRTSTILP